MYSGEQNKFKIRSEFNRIIEFMCPAACAEGIFTWQKVSAETHPIIFCSEGLSNIYGRYAFGIVELVWLHALKDNLRFRSLICLFLIHKPLVFCDVYENRFTLFIIMKTIIIWLLLLNVSFLKPACFRIF